MKLALSGVLLSLPIQIILKIYIRYIRIFEKLESSRELLNKQLKRVL